MNGSATQPLPSSQDYDVQSRVNIDPFAPPPMRTLVYSPDVRVLVIHNGTQYDVSKDVVRVTLIRKENSASTVFVSLANKRGRYSSKITPMDRITVYMKRIRWIQTFSGYVDTGPHTQLYQGVITVKATCTLKRLLHTWWNPSKTESMQLFNQMGYARITAGDGQPQYDSGLGSLLANLLMQVGGWNRSNIHIANFPVTFYNFLSSQIQANQAANQAQLQKFRRLLLGDDQSGGMGIYANYNSSAGMPGPIGAGQDFYIREIMAACDAMGLGPTTQDKQTAEYLQRAAAEGQASGDPFNSGNQKAWETVGEAATGWRSGVMNADAAILGVACAMGESGLRNLANQALPDSLRFPNDGLGSDHDSVGLFQQRNLAEWGSVSQRMNPRQAATMFFSHLAQIDWRNTDPGQAIFQVQRGGSPAYFSGFIPQATKLVQAIREAQQGVSSAITSNPLTGAISSVAGAAGVDVSSTINSVIGQATTSPDPQSLRNQLGKPTPDSESAVREALAQVGKPYVWGAKGPAAFDCSGLVAWAYRAAGIDLSGATQTQMAKLQGRERSVSQAQPGDLIFTDGGGHVQMYIGGGMCVEAYTEGAPVSVRPARLDQAVGGVVYHVADWGGPDPSAPRIDPAVGGPGVPPAGTGVSTGLGGGAGGGQQEPIAHNLYQYIFEPAQFLNPVADLWSGAGGHKDFIDSQPLIQMVQAVCKASMRNFASMPNGDFMAYYPDYFGLDGKPAVLKLEDIELKDVHINVSDDQLTTHVYVAGQNNPIGGLDQVAAWLDTAGTATVEDEWLFARLRQVGLGDYAANGYDLMRRFGVRPLQIENSLAGSHELEFMQACQIFMEKWAAQYETQAAFTFLPELLPGMRVLFSDHKLQVYVSEVIHDIDFERGFTTQATITAPSSPTAADRMTTTTTTAKGPDLGSATGTILNEYLP